MRRLPGNNHAGTSTQYSAASYQRALSGVRLSTRLDTGARQKAGTVAQDCSSFILIRVLSRCSKCSKRTLRLCLFCCLQGRRQYLDALSEHGSLSLAVTAKHARLTTVFGVVVAQPIQDMSAVSITHKTVGIGLPRLRYGTIGWRTRLSTKSHLARSWTR